MLVDQGLVGSCQNSFFFAWPSYPAAGGLCFPFVLCEDLRSQPAQDDEPSFLKMSEPKGRFILDLTSYKQGRFLGLLFVHIKATAAGGLAALISCPCEATAS